MRRILLSSILILTAVSGAIAQEWKLARDGNYEYRYVVGDPMEARFYVLGNGLSVILSVNKNAPRIQTLIGTRAGSNNDPADHTGLAHYLEHLLFKGTDQFGSLEWNKEKPYIDQIENLYADYNVASDPLKRKAIYHTIDSVSGVAAHYALPNEFDKMMSAIGAQGTNAHTSMEETVFEEDIPSNAVDPFLAIEAERFRKPVFRLFHTELEAVYEEKNRGLDNDGQKAYYAMLEGLFPHTNYGKQTTIGSVEHLKNPSLKAIRAFYDKYYVPNNMAIVMVGDFDPSVMIRKIDKAFGYMQAKPIEEYAPAPEQPIVAPVVKNVYGPDAESVSIGFRMPGVADQHSQVLLEVLADLLNNRKAGLMDLDLNQAQKLQNAGAYNSTYRLYGSLQLLGKAKPGQSLEDVRDLLLGELDKVRNGEFDAGLIKAIVNNQKLGVLQAMNDNNFRATNLMGEFIKDKGVYWPESLAFQDNMLKVTKAQVMAFARQWTGNNYVIVYKHTGADSTIVKVEKPSITPIYINKTDQSPFLKKIEAMPLAPIQPQWVDYAKTVQQAKLGPAGILYVHNPENSLFSLTYRFPHHGSWADQELLLAAGYLSFIGTKSKSAADFTKAFYNIACDYHISVSGEETDITISGLQENFAQAARLVEDLIRHCIPDEASLAAYKARVLKGRSDAKLDKRNISSALINYAIYGAKNPFNDNLSDEQLSAISAGSLTDALHRLFSFQHELDYYGPMALPLFESEIPKLHTLPAVFAAPLAEKAYPQISQTHSQVLVADYDMVQAEAYWVRNLGTYDPSQSATVDVFNTYFGTGMSGVVFQTIRESKALAYSTFSQYITPGEKDKRYTNLAYVGAQADKLPEAVATMNALLDTLPPENPALLLDARNSLRQDIATERIKPEDYIGYYLSNQKHGLTGDHRKAVYAKAGQVSYEQLKALHDQALAHQPFTYCILASPAKVSKEGLARYGEVKRLSLKELFGY